jgi:hypothetical protein
MSDQSLRDALTSRIEAWRHEGGDLSYAAQEIGDMLAENPSAPTSQPVVDREALASAYMAFRERNGGCSEGPDCAACRRLAEEEADVAMALARPMPTREQIAEAMHDDQMDTHAWRQGCAEDTCIWIFSRRADAILALLTGSAK